MSEAGHERAYYACNLAPGVLRRATSPLAVRDVSQNTVFAYREATKLFLRFVARRYGRQVIRLQLSDLGPDTVLAFLDHLETERKNCAATRNCRLVAIHRFFAYVADRDPSDAELCRRVLDIPIKKTSSTSMTYLDQAETKALLAAPPPTQRLGGRDRALLTLMYNTGARASEVVGIDVKDLRLDPPTQVRIAGKGRKERLCPLWTETADVLRGLPRPAPGPGRSRRGECSSTLMADASPATAWG